MGASLFSPRCGENASPDAVAPRDETNAPAILHIDLADYVARAAVAPSSEKCPFPEDAMELTLLDAARRCAAGDENQPARRALIQAVLREVERQQWWRDQAEARVEQQRRSLDHLRDGRRKLLRICFELAGFISGLPGCTVSGVSDVLAYVRSRRPSLARAIAWVGPLDAPTTLNARIREEVARG